MRKTIKMPAPQLSWLKEVNIDLDMTGRHYALLASCEGQLPEDVALSILKDLMEEDANKLTLTELQYLFMLVKINSLENNYVVDVECPHCNKTNSVKILLSDADLNPTPSDYEVPKILFRDKDTEKEYSVMPPTMDKISHLYDYFVTEKNADQDKITNDKALLFDFSVLYGLLHLVDSNGNPFVKDTDNFNDLLDTSLLEDNKTPKPTVLNMNKHSTIRKLLELVAEVGSYGVQKKTYDTKCKECGGRFIFPLPLLYGVSD